MEQKKRWNYKSPLKYIWNLVKTYLSNWLVEYNGDLIFICNFFSLNLNNNSFFALVVSSHGDQREKKEQPKHNL